MPMQDADRREYYRIEDQVAVQIVPLADDGDTALPEDAQLFNLLGELSLLDFEAQHLLRQMGERDRLTGSLLRVMNRRIDLIGQAMTHGLQAQFGVPQTVTLSEGGISFQHAEALERDALVGLRLLLMPHGLGLLLRARVAHCQPLSEGSYHIGAEFEALTDAQRQLLARHILQKQAQARRQARELSDQP
ncbi:MULTISPECIES: PilZ domain-containing protein [Pseudomonas]|uniref:PilZ domain-containing protein n=1 Tax=Pseudomonas flexibilis TaxID=706570 RepID=A0A0B2D262_9PSED|nr:MULTISPECIES: PilZ domain-containing protein [Pseudomonas]KHL68599.1 PilZ family type IV pilus assembly protein [Pseudomonas flexibilis]KHO66329.1 pilus assembly protein PilZ [Pseudomonas flexibilis]SCY48594.1 PilZ domain-containing protein [Pseudomonas flexibilis]SIQ93221.1 PilZ domain-containing protein [Pseudomonas flexibilis]